MRHKLTSVQLPKEYLLKHDRCAYCYLLLEIGLYYTLGGCTTNLMLNNQVSLHGVIETLTN